MRNKKNRAIIGALISLTLFGSSVSVLATWSGIVTSTLPPWGGTIDNYSVYVTKTSNSNYFQVYGVVETNALDPHVCLINSNGQSRSGWSAVQQGVTTSATSTALVGYYYYSRAGSNMLEPNQTVIQYQFNPN